MILAGDIGGTKTLIGLFEFADRRPIQVDTQSYPTTAYPGLPAIIEEFCKTRGAKPAVTVAVFGIAGPIINQHAEMTNVEWHVDAAELTRVFAFPKVRLLNDLEAMAYGVPVLDASELTTLQAGRSNPDGNIGLMAAGTGLGQSLLHRIDARYVPVASEGGHTDFAPRTDREIELARFLRDRFGRAEIEHVLSGPGLLNLSNFTHQDGACDSQAHLDDCPDVPAEVSKSALEGNCPDCAEALDLFVSAYGASAGNLALTGMTTGGIFLGGGIAPKILPALQDGRFLHSFVDKGPMRPLLEAMPVHVILNAQSGLLGAAVYANGMR
ncbi:MAG TPA: glucokinase [Vicinamibacterales bacterium]|nr:glucokinase [Vicinamibacterales bacterium]